MNWLEDILFIVSLMAIIVAVRLYMRARRESLEKDLLFEVGRRVSSTLDRDEVLNLILDELQQVVGYDAAAIVLVDTVSKWISYHMQRNYDFDFLEKIQLKFGKGLVGLAAQEGKPIVVRDVLRDPRYVDARPRTRSEIVIPLMVGDSVVAVLNLESNRVGAFKRKDVKLLQAFGSQAAIAIENARLYRDVREKRNLEQEMELAGEIQRALLPRIPPEVPGLEMAAYFAPTRSVGGDLYDLVQLSDGRLGVAIGDISGKGTPAAIMMASLYASFRALTRRKLTLPQIMYRLNNLLCESFGIGRYATFFYGVVDPGNREITYSNAGHFNPLLISSGRGPRWLSEGGIVLGFLPEKDYEEGAVRLQPGDLLVLYTDGIVEATNPDGEMFGEERVAEIAGELKGRPAEEVLDGLRRAVESQCEGCPQEDDITLVVVRVL
jgi:sigma-B regulation protein RsbU (phosphoserine phosphatase)